MSDVAGRLIHASIAFHVRRECATLERAASGALRRRHRSGGRADQDIRPVACRPGRFPSFWKSVLRLWGLRCFAPAPRCCAICWLSGFRTRDTESRDHRPNSAPLLSRQHPPHRIEPTAPFRLKRRFCLRLRGSGIKFRAGATMRPAGQRPESWTALQKVSARRPRLFANGFLERRCFFHPISAL